MLYVLITMHCIYAAAAEHIADPPAHRRVVCYPVQLATPAPLATAVVERKEQGELMVLTYDGDSRQINLPYFYKLVSVAEYFMPTQFLRLAVKVLETFTAHSKFSCKDCITAAVTILTRHTLATSLASCQMADTV